jgi:hypothetical protein
MEIAIKRSIRFVEKYYTEPFPGVLDDGHF